MGQMVSVVEKRSSNPGILRFEANRTLTGQGHERFASAGEAIGVRPAAVLARRLFATGQIDGLHVYSNIVTVHLARGCSGEGLYDLVRELYQYWKPGMEPAVFVEEAPAEVAAVSAGGDGGAGPSAYEQLVPEILPRAEQGGVGEVESGERLSRRRTVSACLPSAAGRCLSLRVCRADVVRAGESFVSLRCWSRLPFLAVSCWTVGRRSRAGRTVTP